MRAQELAENFTPIQRDYIDLRVSELVAPLVQRLDAEKSALEAASKEFVRLNGLLEQRLVATETVIVKSSRGA